MDRKNIFENDKNYNPIFERRIFKLNVRSYHTMSKLNSTKAYLPFNAKPTLGYKTLILKRTMFTSRAANKAVNMALIRSPKAYSTVLAPKNICNHTNANGMAIQQSFKPNSPKATQDFATDGTGHHVITNIIECDLPGCENKHCTRLCSILDKFRTTGNFSHKPTPNSQSEVLGQTDYSGKNKTQHHIKGSSPKQVKPDDLSDYTEYDLTPVPDANNYVNSSDDIFNKIK